MNIKTIEIAGFASALEALRLPFGKDPRSIIKVGIPNEEATKAVFIPTVVDNEDDYLEYGVGEIYTCHIHKQDMKLMQALISRGDEHAKVMRGIIVYAEITAPVYLWCELETYIAGHQRLSSESTMHVDCKGLHGAELQEAKAVIPMGKELKKIDFFSYQCLRNMYLQRKDHRLPEWHDTFCEWLKTLPFSAELITFEKHFDIKEE